MTDLEFDEKVKNYIKNNLTIRLFPDNGYIDVTIYLGKEVISSDSVSVPVPRRRGYDSDY